MLDYGQKRKVRSLMYSRYTVGFLALLSLLFIHSTWSVYNKKKESEKIKNAISMRVDELRQRDNELTEKIDKLDTEYGIEEEIRSKFSVAKENEAMVIVVLEEEGSTTESVEEVTFWERFKAWFK